MRQVEVVIRGRVQGVGYRMAVDRQAAERGLTGWVRNLPDGSVEAKFAGADDSVAAMLDWCKAGPALARVTSIDIVTDAQVEEIPNSGFSVRIA